jgi:hypothetical protein
VCRDVTSSLGAGQIDQYSGIFSRSEKRNKKNKQKEPPIGKLECFFSRLSLRGKADLPLNPDIHRHRMTASDCLLGFTHPYLFVLENIPSYVDVLQFA